MGSTVTTAHRDRHRLEDCGGQEQSSVEMLTGWVAKKKKKAKTSASTVPNHIRIIHLATMVHKSQSQRSNQTLHVILVVCMILHSCRCPQICRRPANHVVADQSNIPTGVLVSGSKQHLCLFLLKRRRKKRKSRASKARIYFLRHTPTCTHN
jgi:hypothetical protein